MAYGIEQLRTLTHACEQEMLALQESITDFHEKSSKWIDLINAHELDIKNNDEIPLIAYDKFLTTLTGMMERCRKLNVFIKLNDLENRENIALAAELNDVRKKCNVMNSKPSKRSAKVHITKSINFIPQLNETLNSSETESIKSTVSPVAVVNKKIDNIEKAVNEKKDIIENPQQTRPTEAPQCASEKDYSSKSMLPVEEYDYDKTSSFELNSTNASEVFNCNFLDVSVYQPGDVINAIVTNIQNYETFHLFITDVDSTDFPNLKELLRDVNLRQYTQMPPKDEVFGVVEDKQILRAVRNDFQGNADSDVDESLPFYEALLLDFGEIIEVNAKNIFYELPAHYREIPAQAMRCRLQGVNGAFDRNEFELRTCLQYIEYKKATFKVVAVIGIELYLDLIDEAIVLPNFNSKPANLELPAAQLTPKKVKQHKTNSEEKLPNGLTQKEYEMLQEEPLNTSNAMKATMGYVPKDESRLCAFFNPKTGGCFKGAKCRLEHTMPERYGWTKDSALAETLRYNQTPMISYAKKQLISITPTHVSNVDSFYAQINDPTTISEHLVWNPKEYPHIKPMQTLPHLYDIVLARYDDGLWYRAKVMDRDERSKVVNVFYVDYGNQQDVHLRGLARCESATALLPFKAQLCRIADVRCANSSMDMRKIGISLLCREILNQTFVVRVVNHKDEVLQVRFDDTERVKLPSYLLELGVLKPDKNNIS